ncbi:zinc-binding alcohol dehydrogenase/oxidoreductase [Pullulanibacillus pueri]|uniref:Putative zinc-type alcohol dehydrogenase-like protein YogA n=1 Tax=Pullulanibacillus pueri TaxID=1437324 RepID=A0A8J3ENR6_9BACL|nr:zinc-binding dehydrogenase [Pullulanibacillus pueri]MBM7680691.1 zinc-binding alcohol dehydrogenase/oxidoreductase [Pullulanibacillus pueri]GGH87517.1 putative zinc-type alcohol dehydrogenase-like protein YogA [Pullulanibacillus pueri]
MKAILHNGTPGFDGLSFGDIEEAQVKKGEVKVRLKTAGLNHRDLFVLNRHTEPSPLIIGSDGAGLIEEVGEDVVGFEKGEEVVIIPSLGWQKKSAAPPSGFEIIGLPFHGTFAETIVLPAENVVPKPQHLTWEQAGVLGLGAVTGHRALFTRGQLEAGQTVFIPGVGGGVATFMVQMAKAVGARVIVSSRSEEKRKKALELGADLAIDSGGDWGELLRGEAIDLVIESVGAATFQKSLNVLRRGGTIVTFGASAGDEFPLNLRDFFYGQYNLLGSTMGSIEEFHEMLTAMEESKWSPVVDSVYPLENTIEAMKALEKNNQFGKIAITLSK